MNTKWLEKSPWFWPLLGSVILLIASCIISGTSIFSMLLSNVVLGSFLVFLCIGQMTVITSGNGAIDLSVQYVIPLAAYLASVFIRYLGPIWGLLLTLVVCLIIGCFNGVLTQYLRIPAIITTLAMGYIVYSAVLIISSNTTGAPYQKLSYFTQKARVFGISPIVFLAAIFSVLAFMLLYKTSFGKELHALGQNAQAARFSGVQTKRIAIEAFAICSGFTGITGILLGGYFGGAFPDMGLSYLLTSIAAPVIGGTSASGGRSCVGGCVAGVLMLTLLTTFINVTGLPATLQNLIQGILLVLILITSTPKTKS